MNTWDFIRNTKAGDKPAQGRRTITADTAREIKRMLREGVPRKKIFDELKHLNVKAHHVSDIACGITWKDA